MYYSIFSNEFKREHKAVLCGKIKYYNSLKIGASSSYLLRRNIHRLEKGLIMPKRRDVFGLDFIEETVDEYVRVSTFFIKSSLKISNELKWASDVLEEYFKVIKINDNQLLNSLNNKFVHARENLLSSGDCNRTERLIPYERDIESNSISFEALQRLSIQRRSVRFFEERIPDREDVDKALSVALQSPSACNRQPFSFRLFDTVDKVREVAAIPAGTKTFYRNVPAIAVVVGHLDAYYRERDRHAIYVDGSLAVMSFVYALETLGMSSCVINWGDEEPAESKMSKLLNLKPEDRVLMLVAYGYPKSGIKVPYSSKRDVELIRTYNEY